MKNRKINGTDKFSKHTQEDTALKASPLNCLHTHRNVLGVIGICHCPTNPDLGEAYAKFEALAR